MTSNWHQIRARKFKGVKVGTKKETTYWYVDTGASNRMSGNRWIFDSIGRVCGKTSFGDASHIKIKGKGRIPIVQKNGKKGAMEDVYYAPNLKSNILSVGQLTEKGFLVIAKG